MNGLSGFAKDKTRVSATLFSCRGLLEYRLLQLHFVIPARLSISTLRNVLLSLPTSRQFLLHSPLSLDSSLSPHTHIGVEKRHGGRRASDVVCTGFNFGSR